MLLPAAAGFIAGIMVAILAARGGPMAILVLAAASALGGTVVRWVRGARDRRIRRAARERLERRIHRARMQLTTTAEVEPGVAGAAKPEDFVAFHDFNTAQGHFNHW